MDDEIHGGIEPRPLPLDLCGGVYYIALRPDPPRHILADDVDAGAFLALLGSACRALLWRCHAFCLLPDQCLIVVETAKANLSPGFDRIAAAHSREIQRRHPELHGLAIRAHRVILIDKQHYLPAVGRYVVLAPVSRGLAAGPDQWRWSNYHATSGAVEAPNWLEIHATLLCLAQDRGLAQQRYRSFVARERDRDSASLWRHLRHGLFLGDPDFVRRMVMRLDPPEVTIRTSPTPQQRSRPPLANFLRGSPQPEEAMRRAYATGQYSLKEIATHFGVHYSTVSEAVNGRGQATTRRD